MYALLIGQYFNIKFVDNELAPNLKKNYGITVNRMDAVYTGCDKAAMKVSVCMCVCV